MYILFNTFTPFFKGACYRAELSKGELLRIKNVANRINKPITVVRSRASGTAGGIMIEITL